MKAIFLLVLFCFSAPINALVTSQWQTKNGAEVIFYQAMELPIVDIGVAFAAGSAYDGKQFGLSALTSQLIDQGNGTQDASLLAERFADIGAQFNVESSRDMLMLHLKTLSNNEALQQAIETLALILSEPRFDEQAFLREKANQVAGIRQMKSSPTEVANLAFFNSLYGQHPYAHAVQGNLASVKQIERQDVQRFYQQYFVGKNATLVIVGAIDNDKAHALAEQLTKGLKEGEKAKALPLAESPSLPQEINLPFASKQTIIRLGQLGITHENSHFFPLLVGNYILGGGSLVSRLAINVREKRGLTYGVDSQFIPLPGIGPFLIGLSTKNSSTKEALNLVRETLKTFIVKGVSNKELIAAKQYLMGSFPLSLASNSMIASLLLKRAFYHLPANYIDDYTKNIDAVTVADIKSAFAELIHPDRMLLVVVGRGAEKMAALPDGK